METLRYADEVNKASGYFRDIPDDKPDEDLLDLASTLIEKKTAPFSADKFTDHYAQALRELVERKMKAKGALVTPDDDEEAPKKGSNVVDLMAALKKSIESPASADAGTAAKKAPARKPARKRAAA